MNDSHRYAVFFYPQALEALGEAIKPYLRDGDAGQHVVCREIDTGGSLIEMTVADANGEGGERSVELMVPSGMVRMVVSTHSDGQFGFAPQEKSLPALPPLGASAQPVGARSAELPQTARTADVPKD